MKSFIKILMIAMVFSIIISVFPNSGCNGNHAWAGDNQISNPGGSPFAPGQEPSLTHTVNVFWTTAGDIDRTEITIKTPGDMPTQVNSQVPKVKMKGWTKGVPVSAMIGPNCNYRFIFLREDSGRKPEFAHVLRHTGMGTLNVLIHGFTSKDYKVVPEVEARYYRGDTLMGVTSVKVHPVSDKIKKQEKKGKK